MMALAPAAGGPAAANAHETEPAGNRTAIGGGSPGPIRSIHLESNVPTGVKLGSSAVAAFGFGFSLWGCRRKRPAPRIREIQPIKVSI